MTSTTERAEPMKGLAEWLSLKAFEQRLGAPDQAAILYRWASEVESLQLPAKAEPTCSRCRGTGIVDDGEITSSGGAEFMNGPIRCVKDCPVCATPAKAVVTDAMVEVAYQMLWDIEIVISRKQVCAILEAVLQASTSSDGVREASTTNDRDSDWVLAIAHALGLGSGFDIPIVPEVEPFKRLFAEVRARAGEQALSVEDAALLARIGDDFADCGETEVPYEKLLEFALRGYLRCEQFTLKAKAQSLATDGVQSVPDADLQAGKDALAAPAYEPLLKNLATPDPIHPQFVSGFWHGHAAGRASKVRL